MVARLKGLIAQGPEEHKGAGGHWTPPPWICFVKDKTKKKPFFSIFAPLPGDFLCTPLHVIGIGANETVSLLIAAILCSKYTHVIEGSRQ